MIDKEQLKKWRESGHEALAAQITPETLNKEERTVDVVWFTGIDVPRYDWWTGASYILRFDPKGADLSLLNNGAPVFDNHNSYDGASGQKGKVEKAWVENGKYLGTLRFSRRPEVDGLWQDIEDKIVTKFSMGVEILESVEKRDKDGKLETRTATKWRAYEISVAPVPADFGTTTLSAEIEAPAEGAISAEAIRSGVLTGEAIQESQIELRAVAQSTKGGSAMPETNNAGDVARTEQVNAEALKAEGKREERERISGIEKLAAPFAKKGELSAEFIAELRNGDKSIEQAREAILEKLAQRSEQNPIQHTHQAGLVTRDERDTRRELMTGAVLHRYDPRKHTLNDGMREYRGMSMVDVARECLNAVGMKTRGMTPMDVIDAALSMNGSFVGTGEQGIERLGMMSTSDFPFILANVANKSLRSAYDMEPLTYKPFVRETTARDFKAKYVNQLGDAPDMDLVPENGEFPYGQIPEARESYRIYTYGKILPFTRQSLINDDLGAFTRVPELQGRAAARKQADLVWALITSNPTMGDSVALFDAAHGNLVTGPGTVISIANLGIARKMMRVQTGLDGTEGLNLEPRFLLVPAALEQIAIQYTSSAYVPAQQSNINPEAGRLTPIVEARLDANDDNAWYLAADPGRIDTIECAYLEGQQGVYLETRMGFNVDGMELKARIDFGCKVIDHRAFIKNVGA